MIPKKPRELRSAETKARDAFFCSADGRAALDLDMPLNDALLRNRMEYVFTAGLRAGREMEREGDVLILVAGGHRCELLEINKGRTSVIRIRRDFNDEYYHYPYVD